MIYSAVNALVELEMIAVLMSAIVLPVMVGVPVGATLPYIPTNIVSSIANAFHQRFPSTRAEADAYKISNPAWKAETLRYLADGIYRAHKSTTGSSTVDLDRFDSQGSAVITSNTTIGQGKVLFTVNVALRDIQTIRIIQPHRSRNLAIELIAQSGSQSIHVWRKMTSSRTNDTFTTSTNRISFVAPESVSSARVLAELVADIIRDAGGSPSISIE